MQTLEARVTEVAQLYSLTPDELAELLGALTDEARAAYTAAPESFTTEQIRGPLVSALLFQIRLPRAASSAIGAIKAAERRYP